MMHPMVCGGGAATFAAGGLDTAELAFHLFANGALAEGFILSGHPVSGAPLHIEDLGPVWLTGGDYGPEGGIVGIGFRFAVIAAVLVWSYRRQ